MEPDEGRVMFSKSGKDGGAHRTMTVELGDEGETATKTLEVQNIFRDFILYYKTTTHLYLEALRDCIHLRKYFLEVKFSDLSIFKASCSELLKKDPLRWLPVFETAAKNVAIENHMFGSLDCQDIQVQIIWVTKRPYDIRQIRCLDMGQLCAVPGIVVKCSDVKQKVTKAVLQCSSCKDEIKQDVPTNASYPQMPTSCVANSNAGAGGDKCRPNPYIIRPDKSQYVNVQYIKLQELPEDVPTGELPRHIEVQVERGLVSMVNPGQRIIVVGINSIFRDSVKDKGRKAVGIRRRYLKGVGLMVASPTGQHASVNTNHSTVKPGGVMLWNAKQEKEFKELAKTKDLHKILADSLAPSIYGHDDIKKACVCQLFGGTRKQLADGGKLRGDMNVLLIGDPSTAKSQLLKAVYQVSPIGVYTSGKGSSAAGLTAAVGREASSNGRAGGFYLEGGSMVLADGGIVCIDEFDKMREQDTVAIHEAMEQQTISVAKAGLSTVLNSRTSVLAAANPTMGCYDPSKTNEEQMNFKATIVSRFDLIFKVLDPPNPEKDRLIATHVLGLHGGATLDRNKTGLSREDSMAAPAAAGLVSQAQLKSYIAYCRANIITKLDKDAEEHLKNFYVQTRRDANDLQKGEENSIIKITVRQLESLVRITESLAKLRCSTRATKADAEEAVRLYRVATVDAIKSGLVENAFTAMQEEEMIKLEQKIESKLPLSSRVRTATLVSVLIAQGNEEGLIEKALNVMSRRGVITYQSHKRYVTRTSSLAN
eukprot:TRINITY_DN17554_c0_g1_i1.p1 TRINITY_DN17554_c0_g1~~TRINITY_DN17554_c0_g1_i1.p1  ORF type:complete len:782 (+),score=129.44 TRINITY_DN17554_c0_g1_i1:54-2348(+)